MTKALNQVGQSGPDIIQVIYLMLWAEQSLGNQGSLLAPLSSSSFIDKCNNLYYSFLLSYT